MKETNRFIYDLKELHGIANAIEHSLRENDLLDVTRADLQARQQYILTLISKMMSELSRQVEDNLRIAESRSTPLTREKLAKMDLHTAACGMFGPISETMRNIK